MAQMKITTAQVNELLKARDLPAYERKRVKKAIMNAIHREHPAIGNHKIKLFIENDANPLFAVIRDKRTGMPLDDGKPELKVVPKKKKPAVKKPVTAAKKVVAKKKPTVKKPVAKKTAAKKTATKTATPVKKAAVKRPAAKKSSKK